MNDIHLKLINNHLKESIHQQPADYHAEEEISKSTHTQGWPLQTFEKTMPAILLLTKKEGASK